MNEINQKRLDQIAKDTEETGYQILEYVGGGGFVDVFRVSKADQLYAIKVSRGKSGSESWNKLDKDYALSKDLNSEYVVRPIERFQKHEYLYIVVNFAKCSLVELIKSTQGLDFAETVSLSRMMCHALIELEYQNIVHRDIKPANILLSQDGNYLLSDFGLAQIVGGSEGRHSYPSNPPTHPGTPEYKSPEQEKFREYLYPSSDIYSLGCVLFEALTGELYRKNIGISPRKLGVDIPRWYEKILKRCLFETSCPPNKKPKRNQRYSSASQILRDLNKFDPKPIQQISQNEIVMAVQQPKMVWHNRGEKGEKFTLFGEHEISLSRIPAGDFIMGGDDQDPDVVRHETPRRTISLGEYFISIFPITNHIFRYYLKDIGDTHRLALFPKGRDDHPVIDTTWYQANEFCDWASKASQREIRLPSEKEWEKSARGESGNIYPWGNVMPSDEHCNFNNTVGDTTPAGFYSPIGDSEFNCADMAGNVWEWTSSDEDGQEYGVIVKPWDMHPKSIVIRGGAVPSNWKEVRSSCRRTSAPSGQGWKFLGFRIVIEA
jgi:toxoflavin biosynthesis protein ToxD